MRHPDQSIRGYFSRLIWLCLLLVVCFIIGTMIQVGLRWQSMTQLVESEVLSLTLPTIIATHTQPLIALTATREPSPTSATTSTPRSVTTQTSPATVTLFPSPRSQASKTPQPTPTIVIEYIVQAGDTLSEIAAKFNISLADLLDANPEQNATVLGINDVLIIPPRATPTNDELETYMVQRGDTLLGIASQFDISLPDLQAANPNLDPTRLTIGDPIVIPDPSEKKE